MEREQTVQAEKEPEIVPVVDEVGSDSVEVDTSAVDAPAPEKGDNFTITDDNLGDGGAKTKFRANVDAIKTLKTLEREKRPATAEEKETLSKYVGWGALAKAFDKDDPKWAAEYKELSELLTPQEYAQARSTVNDAFYTSPTVIDGIYEALGSFGFDGGNVLEPAMGIGNFFGRMPEDMQSHSQLYGVEIDSLSGRIAQALYPDADIAIQGFEQNRFQNSSFDVAVGNVPFGELGFRDTVHDTTKLHDFFFAEALDKLKNGGIMAFVTSAGTLDKRDESVRQMLADKADFIGAIRLPGGKNGAFNSITELHTMMRYLEYDFLRDHGLQHFDNWVAVFGDQKTDWELKPAGNGFKERTRIANYTGLPELMSMFKQVADIRTADTLKLDVPECDYQVVQVEATPFQQELVQELADRADAINAGNVDPTIDNMLKITSDGRKLGLDPRLIDPSFEDNPDTKLNRCVENVARIHAETAEDRLTQIIFCDLGVPHKAAEAAVEGEDADDAKDKKSIAEVESL